MGGLFVEVPITQRGTQWQDYLLKTHRKPFHNCSVSLRPTSYFCTAWLLCGLR